jgi:Domain of unknown function (DUF5666)/Viral BACON domain
MVDESRRQRLTGVVFWLALVAAGCGGTEVSQSAGPTPVKCGTALSGMPGSFAASGARLNVMVSTPRECAWEATTDAGWLQVSPSRGQGEAPLTVIVSENTVAASRSGAVVVNDTRVNVTQQAAPCRFRLNRSSVQVPPQGGSITVSVTATAGCAWTASSATAWIRGVRTSGNGSGDAEFSVEPNGSTAHAGTITVAGLSVAIAQAAGNRSYTGPPEPPAPNPPAPVPPDPPAPTPPGPAPAPTPPSDPEPEPDPSPTPTPEPPPPSADVSIAGRVSRLSGTCPSLSFSVDRRDVITDQKTRYTKGNCRRLEDGMEVKIEGVLLTDGVVRATKVELRDR